MIRVSGSDCVFCRILVGEIPAEVVVETAGALAFRDLDPQAPTHVLVIPKEHHASAAELAAASPLAVAELVSLAAQVAELDGLGDHYRLVFNTGSGAGQSVFHVHLHLLGGRALAWPPG